MVLAALMAAGFLPVAAGEVRLILLHTGGLQGRYEQLLKVGPVYRQLRQEGARVLLLDAGGVLSPSEAAFASPDGGRSLAVSLFNRAGYHAWTLGGEDLAVPADLLTSYLREAGFPVLGANLHRPDTGRYLFQVQPYTTMRMGGVRIAVLGLSSGGSGMAVADPVAAARYYVPLLEGRADVVVLLTHLGFEADSTLAASVAGIDAIVGARPPPDVGPRMVNGVPIGYAREKGASLGRIDLALSEGKVVAGEAGQISLEGEPQAGEELAPALAGWTAEVDGETLPLAAVLGTSAGGFEAEGMGAPMGHLIADLLRAAVSADIGFVSSSNVNPYLPEGPIRVLDLFRIYGWPHEPVILSAKGRQIREFLEGNLEPPGEFFYPSGLSVVYDFTRPEGERIISVRVGEAFLEEEAVYRVAVESRIATRAGVQKGLGDLMEVSDRVDVGVPIRDLLARHIRAAKVIRGTHEQRVRPN